MCVVIQVSQTLLDVSHTKDLQTGTNSARKPPALSLQMIKGSQKAASLRKISVT